MAKKSKGNFFGHWAFLIGIILAVVFGLIGLAPWVIGVLVILGLVVGFLNISGKETQAFLLAGTVLVIVTFFGGNIIGKIPILKSILDGILALFVPATIIVAIKSVWTAAQA